MRYTFTIFLAFTALILGALAVVFMGSSYRNAIFGTPPIAPGNPLFEVKALDQVSQITLTNSDGDEASFEVDSHYWKAVTPWKDRADPLFIKFLIQFTARLEVKEVLPREDLELKEFGLRDGHVRVTMRDSKGNKVCDYRIGRPTAWHIPSDDGKSTQPTIFIRLADKKLKENVYVCAEDSAHSVHALFQNQFERFRDHHPFHFSPKYLDKLRLQSDQGEVVISRKNLQSGWGITKPLELRVDHAAQAELFKSLAKLTALKVEDRASVTLPTGEDESAQAREISIHFAGADTDTTLRIYPPAKENDPFALATISDRPDAVFQLPLTTAAAMPGTTSLSQLQLGVNDLRSKTMTHLNGPQLKTIILKPSGRMPVMLQRTKRTTWRVLRSKGWEEANQDAIIALMMAVTRDKVQKFVTDAATDLKPYGLDQPDLQMKFFSFNPDEPPMHINIGMVDDSKGKAIYAHRLDKPNNIWQISSETLGKIALNSWQWRTSHVWHLPKVDVEKISISRKGKPPVELTYTWHVGKWEATRDGKDASAMLNPNRANKFLSTLESLKTKSWIGPQHPQATKRLQDPDMTVSVTLRQVDNDGQQLPPIVKTITIAGTPGGLIYFAKINTIPRGTESEGENSFFLLDPATINKLVVDLFE